MRILYRTLACEQTIFDCLPLHRLDCNIPLLQVIIVRRSIMVRQPDILPESNGVYSSTRTRKVSVAFIFIVLAVFLCFAPDLRNDFVYTWDDAVYITNNDHIQSMSLEMLSWAFFSVYAYYWAPLTWLTLAADRACWGLNPLGYHLTNNILHALNAGLFFLLVLQLLQRHITLTNSEDEKTFPYRYNHIFFCSLLAALFFAIHPLRAESVAWITERKDVLSLFFGISAVITYIKYTESVGKRPGTMPFVFSKRYWLAVTLFCFSLLSKSTLVTLPLVLLVLDWFPLGRLKRSGTKVLLMEKSFFLLIAGVVAAIILSTHQSASMPLAESDILSRVLIAFKSVMHYLWFMLWPINLSPFYLHPGNVNIISLEYVVPVLFILIVTIYSAMLVKRKPVLLAVWLIYLITLMPLLGFAQVSNTIMSDRFTYIPSMPISILVALAITRLGTRLSDSRVKVNVLLAAVALLLISNAYLTIRQLSFWKNDVALWSRAIDVNPHFSGRTYFMRATSYMMTGEYEKALIDINEAIAIADRKKRSQMDDLYSERARILSRLGNYNCAIADYTKALEYDSSPKRSVYYLERGQLYKEQGMQSLANEDFKSAAIMSGNK